MQKTTNGQHKRLQVIVANGLIMALYVAVTVLVTPFSSGAIQFRVSEGLNHLVVFNRKLMWGVLGGVLLYNLFFGMGLLDVIFGGGQTLLALSLTAMLQKKVPDVKIRLALNTVFFTISMFLIALMLNLTLALPFWPTYGTTALSELIIMSLTAPVMYAVDKAIQFEKRF